MPNPLPALPPGFVLDTAPPPPVIPGAPRAPAAPTPLQKKADERADKAADRAERAERRQAEAAAQGSEAERTAGFLAGRVVDGVSRLGGAIKKDADAARPTIGAELARGVFGDTAANFLTDAERQQVRAAQIDIIDAALTLGTGAAYTKEQIEGYREAYFPQLGDDPATIKSKQAALRSLIVNAQTKAGRAAPDIGRALAALDAMESGEERGEQEGTRALPSGATERGPLMFGPQDDGPGFTPEQKKQIEAFARQAKSPEELEAFARGLSGGQLGVGNAAAVLEHYRKHGQIGDVVDPPTPDVSDARSPENGGFLENIDASVRGMADVFTLGLSDEISAAGDTLFGDGTMRENLARQRAIDAYDTENNFASRLTGQAGAGFFLPVGASTRARHLAMIGGGYGGAYGFGSGEGSVGDRGVNALIHAGTGAVLGGGIGAGANLLRGDARSTAANELIAAAQRQGIDVLPADVGGPMTRRLTAGAAQAPFATGPIARGAARTQDLFENRVGAVAASEGQPVRQEGLGEFAEKALGGYNARTGAAGRAAYEQARAASGEAGIRGEQALAALDANIAELSGNASTNAPLLAGLQRLRGDLADEAGARVKSVDDMRSLRTAIRAEAQSEGLRATDYQRRASQVLDALSEDIASQLPREAAAEFRKADKLWKERLDFIDDVEARILGPKGERSAEDVAKRLAGMSRSDSARFGRLIDSLPSEEAGVLRSSLISGLGRPPPGQPGSFSVETWARQYRSLPERTRNILFRGENRAHAEDLRVIAEGIEGSNRFRNTSNTAGAQQVSEGVRALSYAGAWASLGTTVVLENLTGRLLASPRFARWLARPPKDRGRAVRRLAQIANREPALASDINPIIAALSDAANDNAARAGAAAASPEERPRNAN